MLNARIIAGIAAVSFLFVSCSREFKADSITLGSNVSGKGLISETNTSYTFSFDKTGTMKDLFNYIYFEGDTVCFSADFTQDISGEPSAFFIDPATGVKIKAERIEKLKSRVYGFSLVGSLLEHFMQKQLDEKIPASGRTIIQPYIIRVEASNGNTSAVQEIKGSFTVRY